MGPPTKPHLSVKTTAQVGEFVLVTPRTINLLRGHIISFLQQRKTQNNRMATSQNVLRSCFITVSMESVVTLRNKRHHPAGVTTITTVPGVNM
ncbi:hypothetical protein CCH79_00001022 [Gambusia affinis]|uniref:Uncharacterized protein n=1 Tax=Gambusia affinis TaxID=33528 RepID=A0A315VW23_GAMAF|nr:hypothetical protein CCH79_00001022 [Gambusia affinis]